MSQRIAVIIVLCVISHSVVMGQAVKKFAMPAGSTSKDYARGVVWVKLKRSHKDIFSDRAAGRIAAEINAHQIQTTSQSSIKG